MCGSHVTAQCCVEWPVGISVATVCVSIDFHPRKLTRELTGGSFRAKMWKNPGRWKSSSRKKGETSAVNSHSVVATGNVRLPLAKGREKKEVNMSLKWNTVNSKTALCSVSLRKVAPVFINNEPSGQIWVQVNAAFVQFIRNFQNSCRFQKKNFILFWCARFFP